MERTGPSEFDWAIHREAARLTEQLLETFRQQLPGLDHLGRRMLDETGTRLVDWIDHFSVPDDPAINLRLQQTGFQRSEKSEGCQWNHPGGIFPTVRITDDQIGRLVIKVESVEDFLFCNVIDASILGLPQSPLRTALAEQTETHQLWVIERHGCTSFGPPAVTSDQISTASRHAAQFTRRHRDFENPADGFRQLGKMIDAAIEDVGVDWACDLFFAAERRYWQSRNHAARLQKARQDRLGLGWANHDHHTYRCSRNCFAELVRLLEQLGFVCRERFYGGAEAGWGAQVLEQHGAGIVVFADVDLSPEEVMGDFAHDGLESSEQLGTVGLWCKLHGEAIFQAGMHHLECQFDFDAARKQLAAAGVETMAPFTDMPQLKQAFTAGQVWPVKPQRIDAALSEGSITPEQATQFASQGSIGAHLEILERNGGYKGFNQTGISDIIRRTDPRR